MWISRAVWNTVQAELAAARQVLHVERERYAALVAEMAGMVREGYRVQSAPQPVDVPQLSERVLLAIHELAGGSHTPTGRHLARWALQESGAGATDDQIIERIRNGE